MQNPICQVFQLLLKRLSPSIVGELSVSYPSLTGVRCGYFPAVSWPTQHTLASNAKGHTGCGKVPRNPRTAWESPSTPWAVVHASWKSPSKNNNKGIDILPGFLGRRVDTHTSGQFSDETTCVVFQDLQGYPNYSHPRLSKLF